MTLLEITEPLFQYVCRLNRLARKSGAAPTGETTFISKSGGIRGANLEYTLVRNDIAKWAKVIKATHMKAD